MRAYTTTESTPAADTRPPRVFLNHPNLVRVAENSWHKEPQVGQLPECLQTLG